MKKMWIFLSVCILMQTQSTFAGNANKIEIKVLTFNAWMVPVQRKMAKARAEAIGRELGKYDISLMQETFTAGIRKTMATLARTSNPDLNNRYQSRAHFKLNAGVFTFTHYKIVKSDFLRYFNCGGIQCLSGKGVLYVQVELPNGQLLDLFNTHLQAYEKDVKVRLRQLKRAMKFINKHNDGTNPAIFGGDFNVIGTENEYTVLSSMLNGFKDVWKELRPTEAGYTWNPSVNPWAEYDYHESSLLQRLDYIFIRDGKLAKWSMQEVNLAFDEMKIWYGVYKKPNYIFASDHFGVETVLELETTKLN